MKTPKHTFLIVAFDDSAMHGRGEWQDIKEIRAWGAFSCWASGWVLKDGKRNLILAPHLSPEGHACGTMTIPQAAIRERWEVL